MVLLAMTAKTSASTGADLQILRGNKAKLGRKQFDFGIVRIAIVWPVLQLVTVCIKARMCVGPLGRTWLHTTVGRPSSYEIGHQSIRLSDVRPHVIMITATVKLSLSGTASPSTAILLHALIVSDFIPARSSA